MSDEGIAVLVGYWWVGAHAEPLHPKSKMGSLGGGGGGGSGAKV